MQTAKEILRKINWPVETVVFDFETFFDTDYSLSKLSTIEYITDSRFDFLGLAVNREATHHEDGRRFYPKPELAEYIAFMKGFHGPNLEGITIIDHNSMFDISILYHKFGISDVFNRTQLR